MESAAEEVDGVPLKSKSDVGVDGGGDADVGVAEEFLDHDEFDALFQEDGGGGVAEIVEGDAAEVCLAEERGEGPIGLPCAVANTCPLCCHVAPAVSRSCCCWSWWCFSDWAQRVGSAMRSSEARVLVGSGGNPLALVRWSVRQRRSPGAKMAGSSVGATTVMRLHRLRPPGESGGPGAA